MTPSSSGYISNIDAVRAISILGVMAFHAHYLAAGWVGVWVFFVISGFLITRSLLSLSKENFFSALKIFYIRRSLRIWPAYYVFVTLCTIVIFVAHMDYLKNQIIWVYLYLANVMPLFGIDKAARLFGHLWSLAVEEQYYLLIAPLFLWLGPRKCVPLFVLLIVLTPVIRWFGFDVLSAHYGAQAPELIKRLTPFQIDSFMVGGLIALYEKEIKAWSFTKASVICWTVVGLCVAALVANYYALGMQHVPPPGNLDRAPLEDWRLSPTSFGIAMNPVEFYGHVWMYSVIAFLSAVLIIVTIRFGNRYRLKPLNEMGRVSYGMYLYHVPMVAIFDRVLIKLHIAKMTPIGVLCFFGLVLVVYLISVVSYKWLEAPLLRTKEKIAAHA